MNKETYILYYSLNIKDYAIDTKASKPNVKNENILFEGTYRQCLGRFAHLKKKNNDR